MIALCCVAASSVVVAGSVAGCVEAVADCGALFEKLASNALSTIKAIDENLFERVMGKFTFTGTRTNGIKDGIRTEWYTKFDAITKMAEYFKLPYTGVIDRPDLQEILLDEACLPSLLCCFVAA